MARPGDSSKYIDHAPPLAADAAIQGYTFGIEGRYDIPSAGAMIKIPTCIQDYYNNGWEIEVRNPTTGLGLFFCKGASPNSGFSGGRDLLVLQPGTVLKLSADKGPSSGYLWNVTSGGMVQPLPTEAAIPSGSLTWTGSPTGVTAYIRYKIRDGICHGTFQVAGSNGVGATGLTIAMPEGLIPFNSACDMPFQAWAQVGSGIPVNIQGYIPQGDSTGENRIFKFRALPTLTSASSFAIWGTFWFEVDGSFTALTVTPTQTGGPATLTKVYRMKVVDGLLYFYFSGTSADGAGTTACTITPPTPGKNWAAKLPMVTQLKVDTTWSDPQGYIDCTQATAANRLMTFDNMSAWTSTKAMALLCAGIYPIAGEVDNSTTAAVTWPSATLTPHTPVVVSKYYINSDRAWWLLYITSTDGENCSGVTIRPPAPPIQSANIPGIMVCGEKLVNATLSDPGGYLLDNNDDPTQRLLTFLAFGTATTGQAFALRQMAFYSL